MGIFAEELSACAALVQIGPARQSFWALHLRGSALRQRTRLLPRRREVLLSPAGGGSPGRLRIADLGVALEVELDEQPGIVALCPDGRGEVWTRKQAGVPARGTLSIDGSAARPLQALAVIDDTSGHHARVTEWRWSAGVGQALDGAAVAWNLVSGINDPACGSERAVWVSGMPHEVPPVSFAEDLESITAAEGSLLRFTPEAERARRESLLILSSDYRAPFGSFSGALPGPIELAWGRGVMEHHRARW